MWLKRKRKNRRFEREHILDVKLRSSQRRQTRWRRSVLGLGILLSVFFGLFVAWRGGEWLLRHFLYENPAFAIHRLEVRTDGSISLEQLRRWAGVKLEDNLLALDLGRVKRDLELVSAIQSVAVERVLPHTVKIRVTEREPVARFIFPHLRAGGAYDHGVYLFDAEGYVLFPLEPQERSAPLAPTDEHLPTLIGVPVTELRLGKQVETPQVRAALQLIEAFDRSTMVGQVDLKLIDVSLPNMLQVTTGQSSEVTFGLNDLDGQLRRWRAVYDHGQKTGRHLAWLDLSVANNVPARWLDASLVSPDLPKASKPSRNKRKNV
jgi:cell division septal protein FtsQ